MRTVPVAFCLALRLTSLCAPAEVDFLEAITHRQPGTSMRATSGSPVDNADSAKSAIGGTKVIAEVRNLCFLSNVTVSGPPGEALLCWDLEGKWDLDPEATLIAHLRKVDPHTGRATDVARLAEGISPGSRSVKLDLSDHNGEGYRVVLRKEGDSETSGHSDLLDLE